MFIRQNYRAYPNKEQRTTLNKWFGQARFVWNHMLRKNVERYELEKKFLLKYDMNMLLPDMKKNEETSWLKDVPSQCLQQKCQDLDTALKSSFKKTRGFPRFKSKKTDCSGIRFPQGWKFVDGKLCLPKMNGLRIKLHRPLLGKPGALTLIKDRCGAYFVSILVEVDDSFCKQSVENINDIVGIDLGIKEFAVLSDGEVIANPRFMKKSRKRLDRLQRRHSKKQKKSNNREKARIRLARQHRKVANQRKNFVNQVAVSITKNNDLIVVEDLNVNGMVKNRKLSSAISDVGWGMFTTALKWQCQKRGKHLQIIDRWFPSSKTCSCCGWKNDNLTLKDRTFNCEECANSIDRDLNAAINIHNEGLKQFQNTVGTTEIDVCQIRVVDGHSGQEARLSLTV